VDKTSFDNVINKVINTFMQWFSDLSTEELAKIPKVVAGNKIDCRNDKNEDHM
jgi:GTPase SAR1 family protein